MIKNAKKSFLIIEKIQKYLKCPALQQESAEKAICPKGHVSKVLNVFRTSKINVNGILIEYEGEDSGIGLLFASKAAVQVSTSFPPTDLSTFYTLFSFVLPHATKCLAAESTPVQLFKKYDRHVTHF